MTDGVPRTVFAVPLFNQAAYVEEAVSSILGQTDRDLAVLLVDDCSTDGTAEVAAELAARDPRASYIRNEHRLGLAGNWRRGFELARERHPDASYFAWGSDHDRWAPEWLSTLRAALEAEPEAVLAYPHFERLDEHGETRLRRFVPFSTTGLPSPSLRFAHTVIGAPAGRMIYGLFRANALERTNGFAAVVAPDRMLLLELSLQGEFVQVDGVLWSRRFRHRVSAARQRRGIWPHGSPAWSLAPWWVQHTVVLTRRGGAPFPLAAAIPALTGVRSTLRGASWTKTRIRRRSRQLRTAAAARVRRGRG